MKTCKDCYHYDVCGKKPPEDTTFSAEQYCPTDFKDKSLVLDLPCKVGGTVYMPQRTATKGSKCYDCLLRQKRFDRAKYDGRREE